METTAVAETEGFPLVHWSIEAMSGTLRRSLTGTGRRQQRDGHGQLSPLESLTGVFDPLLSERP